MFATEWLEIEREVWAPPELLSPAEWAERYRVLTRVQSDRHGRLSHTNAPYLVGIMDLGSERELSRWPAARPIEELYVVKPAQVGVSEAIRSVIGHAAERDPDPMLIVLPSETTGRKIVRDRILPLFSETPVLRKLISARKHDATMSHIALRNGFVLRLGYSGSPASLASDPARRAFLDEVDKYADFGGKEGDPISLARARTRTYQNRMIYVVSTPTTRAGYIWNMAEAAPIQLHYLVPCPHCEKLQPLTLAGLKWEKPAGRSRAQLAAWLEDQDAAVWYECRHCAKRIDETSKPRMSAAGVWSTLAQDGAATHALCVSPARICYDGWDAGRRAALYVDPFYCLWIRWREIAAAFLRAKDNMGALMEFTNQTLGKVFEQQIERPKDETFAAKSAVGGKDRVAPAWAKRLLMTVDCQKDHYWYVVRAWGPGFRSRRVDHGRVTSLAEILAIGTNAIYPSEGEGQPGMRCALIGIDAGYRPYEVYALSLKFAQVKALKGEGKARFVPPRASRVTYTPPSETGRGPLSAFVHLWYPNYYKDLLSARIAGTLAAGGKDVPLWELSERNDPEYNAQMCGEHRVFVKKNGRFAEVWMKVATNSDNHLWDCEAMQCALAEIARVDLLTTEQPRSWRDRIADRRHV